MSKPFYITTTLPYVNADPHVGFAMEIIRADAVARYQKLLGREVFFNTGTDEHGIKIYEKAFDYGGDTQTYVDNAVIKFKDLKHLLQLSDDLHFIRTTDAEHILATQELWKRCDEKGFIYKKNYKAKYCTGCELERTDSEIENGRCFIHQNIDLVIIDEENYFFKFSEFQKPLLALYEKNPTLVIPDFRFNEIKKFVESGLEDFSISRLKEKMPWGVSVPGDDNHVMYVWFDALTNYISTLGWPKDADSLYKKFWEDGQKVQYCGKDNLRQQSAMWQAMLLAVGLPTTDTIIINGFINSGGQKMSKSLGNVISPSSIIDSFIPVAGDLASDVLRYYLLRHINSFEDSDMTMETVQETYQANLANGLGNLVSRIMTLSERYCEPHTGKGESNLPAEVEKVVASFDLQKAMNLIWHEIKQIDEYIAAEKPFSIVKEDEQKGRVMIAGLVDRLFSIAHQLSPFLPKTAEKILSLIKENKKPETPLFVRL